MLKDLKQLGNDAHQKCLALGSTSEVTLSDTFKTRYNDIYISHSQKKSTNIIFNKHTSFLTTDKKLNVYIPNQWFIIASYFVDFSKELDAYKEAVTKCDFTKDEIISFKSNELTDNDRQRIRITFKDDDAKNIEKFLSNYDWWSGGKTIDRDDFKISSILKLAQVRHDTQAFIPDITAILCQDESLLQYITIDDSGKLHQQTNNPNTIYYGAPGTGKSHKIKKQLEGVNKDFQQTVTFHPEYDYASFIGGYKPITEDNEIKYKFVPQAFINMYVKAWNDPDNQYYLVIEEINRGNCAEIFGDIFQILDNNDQAVEPSQELRAYLEQTDVLGTKHEGIKNGLKMPTNLTLFATMNTSDQSLFPMDSAFKRRWEWEYIPINYDRSEENKSAEFIVKIDENQTFSWLDFIEKSNNIIKSNDNLGMDKCIGNYFIDATRTNNKISLKTFINKAIFYLWNDVFKDEDETIFPTTADGKTYYEDFFPIETNGKDIVLQVLESLDVEVLNSEQEITSNENPD